MEEQELIPLFPLQSVLFPGGRLQLQIFEQRYLDLVSHCMKTDTGFGICLISKGDEIMRAGTTQQVHRVGVYARIVDWDKLPNGLLGITAEGQRKFTVQECWPRDDKLLMAAVEWSAADYLGQEPIPRHLAWRLAELLPVPAAEKQRLLELDNTHERLQEIEMLLATVMQHGA